MSQEPKKKPSWTEKMPERDDAPEMQMQIENDEDFGLDRDSLGFDRDSMSSLDDDASTDELTDNVEIQKALEEERKKNAAQLERIKVLEAQQLEVEKLETEKLEAEKLEAEKLASQQVKEKELQAQKIEKPNPEIKYTWKKIKNTAPEYPSKAARSNKSGWVDVELVIDVSGKVVESRVVRAEKGMRTFDKSALKAVSQWKYEPPANYGITSNQTKTVRLIYKL